MKKKIFVLSAIFTLCMITTSAFLVGHFIQLNYNYIVNPETSPGFNENTPFGDGGDVWREKGIYIPSVLISLMFLFNAISFVMHFCTQLFDWRILLFGFLAAILVFVLAVFFTFSLYVFLSFFSIILMVLGIPLIPAGIVFSIVFLVLKKRLLAGHTALLTLSMAASFAMEMFSCYLYLD